MTKEELLKLEPGTLVDVTTNGVFVGTRSWNHLTSDGCAVVLEDIGGSFHSPKEISLHVPQPQVSGTIETPPKLYTFRLGNATPATEEQIMAQECVRESRNTIDVLNDEIAKRNETIHNLRMRVEQLEAKLYNERGQTILAQSQVSILEAKLDEFEAPPTTDEVKHAYDSLIVAGYKDEARVLQTLSRVVERLSEELSAKDGGRN